MKDLAIYILAGTATLFLLWTIEASRRARRIYRELQETRGGLSGMENVAAELETELIDTRKQHVEAQRNLSRAVDALSAARGQNARLKSAVRAYMESPPEGLRARAYEIQSVLDEPS